VLDGGLGRRSKGQVAVIIVVEGPSAAGKTTYALARADAAYIPENAGLTPPKDASSSELADFWAVANSRRWARAVEVEKSVGRAVCDTDPLKLHYDYCLNAIGMLDRSMLLAGVEACRRAIEAQKLGVADLIVCSIPEAETLAERKTGDRTRTRRNFAVHARLAEPLRSWYEALDAADPGRVRWEFPDDLPESLPRDRYDVDLYDAWMTRLGLID
jgi:hypothetical protein